ncbi:uncharacterized protein F4822DRAFT_424877 [Hypoxylon trugodes]|uniref:uncharacterized protein n=1 Tax=Hypoxylon trugodes TaxID=326681 RepID=UPI00219963EF|nr:uncharacterized protein F4822DRAFT_424877 [Hypoxylon trugodes]KAI1394399.1 hypothetical protein F4822DRAFT_424877 [Hypoxylon trugodes]
MKFTLASLAPLLLVALRGALASPLLEGSLVGSDDTCGKTCSVQSDCSGTCSFCSTPAEYRWACKEP